MQNKRGFAKGLVFNFLLTFALVFLITRVFVLPACAADESSTIKVFYSEGTSGEGTVITQRIQRVHPEVQIDYRSPGEIRTYLPSDARSLLNRYDAIMFSDVSYSRLTSQQVQAIRDYVQLGGGFVMIGGTTSLGPGGYGGTLIEQVLPVTCPNSFVEKTLSVQVVYPEHPILQGLPMDTIPTVGGYCVVNPKTGADLVLKTSNGAALLVCWPYGKGRSVVFSSDISWLWGAQLKTWAYYETFVTNMLKWAAGGPGYISGNVKKVAKLDPAKRTESLIKEPVDTGTGAHVLERNLLTVNGAQDLSFIASYNSLLLDEGPLGKGWGHDFETRLKFLPNGDIDLCWTANRVNSFIYQTDGTYSSPDNATRFDTLVKNTDGSFTLKRKDQSVYEFNSAGRLTEVKNKHGQAITLGYDGSGRLATITEAVSGRSLTLHYNANNLIDCVTDPLGRQVTFGYDANHNLTRITDAAGYSTEYTYDADGRVLTATDDAGVQIFADTYDSLGRVAVQDDGVTVNQLTYFYYDEDSQPGTVITTVYDRNGNIKVYTHDSSYQLLSVRDELGCTNSYTYDDDGNKKTFTDAKGRTTTYGYDARGNLLTVTDPFGRTTTMTYDANDNLKSLTNPVGATVYYSYDDASYPNNITRKTDQLGNETNYEYYPENGLLKKVTSPCLGQTQYTYVAGEVYSVTDPAYNTTTYGYDAAGRLTSTTDGAGKTTTYQYDGSDNLTTVTDPPGQTTTYTYDCHHNKLTKTDAKGNTTYYEYDNNGNLAKVRNVVGAVYYETTYRYDDEDRLKYFTDANGNTTTYNYDAKGRLIETVDPLGHTTAIEYDELDRITGKTDAVGNRIMTITYDDANNTQTVTDALYRSTVNEHDAADRLFRSTDPMGRITQYSYDGLDRLISVIDPMSGMSSQRFDADGNLEALIDLNNYETAFNYDLAGRLRSKTFASGNTISYDYNSRSLVERMTNGRGQVTAYEYYDDGRLRSFTDPAGMVSYQYDANGNVVSVSEGVYTITREYDELDRVTRYIDSRGNTIQYEYDPVGNLKVLTYPDGKQVKYDYYDDNRLKTVTDWANRVSTYEYYANGLLWKTIRPNGTVQTLEYDAAGQLTRLQDVDGSDSVIVQYDYTYHDDGNVAAEQSSVEEVVPDAPDTVMTYTYDNCLATFNGQSVEYDADGNMTYGPLNGVMAAYTYDARNRLVSAGDLSYIYDAENNRIAVIQGVYRTDYVINLEALLNQVLVRTDAEGNQTFYVYGLGLIGQEENGDYRTYHYDLRGSTVALTDATGTVTDRFQYGPYGELVNHTGTTVTPFLYNGRDGVMTDGNGLYYMQARYYSPEGRRFVSRDLVIELNQLSSLNTYAYCENDPVNMVDPKGLWGAKVHRDYTYDWVKEVAREYGLSRGMSKELAEDFADIFASKISKADVYVDSQEPYERGRHLNTNLQGRASQLEYAEYYFTKAVRFSSLEDLGIGLHSLQDWVGHGELFWVGRHLWKWVRDPDNPDKPWNKDLLNKTELLTKEYIRSYFYYSEK